MNGSKYKFTSMHHANAGQPLLTTRFAKGTGLGGWWQGILFAWLLLQADGAAAGHSAVRQKAEQEYMSARLVFHRNPTDIESAWKLGRACFELAEVPLSDHEREHLAEEGIAACRQSLEKAKTAGAHYYLALNYGQLARTKTLGALKLVKLMETEFLAARALDSKFDHGGPDRTLGRLYLEAPGWPTSIGSEKKARQHLARAVDIEPAYPENRLTHIEALVEWKDMKAAEREFQLLKRIWPQAREEFKGADWEADWSDWTQRYEKIQSQFN